MCIGDVGNCALLSYAEQRAQHNFEERKGPYPFELAERLERDGIMTQAEHLRRSVTIRNSKQIEWHFKYGDRMPEETAYVEGRRHKMPMDEYLTPQNQALVVRLAKHERRIYFVRQITTRKKSLPVEFFIAYPESGRWLNEMLATRVVTAAWLARKLATNPTLLSTIAVHIHDSSLPRIVFHLAVLSGSSQDCLAAVATHIANGNPDTRRKVEEVVRLEATTRGEFPGSRSRQRLARRQALKRLNLASNRLYNDFKKRNDAPAIMTQAIHELRTLSRPTFQQAA